MRVQADGSVMLEGARIERSALAGQLQALRAQSPRSLLSLESSDEADYNAFAQTLAAARNAGFADIAIRR